MFITFIAAKMLGSDWLVYVMRTLLRTQKHQMLVHAQTAALGMKFHLTCRQSGSRMERSTNTEVADMHLAALRNGRAAQRLSAQRYTWRVTPNHTYFARLHQRLSDNGFFIMNTRAQER